MEVFDDIWWNISIGFHTYVTKQYWIWGGPVVQPSSKQEISPAEVVFCGSAPSSSFYYFVGTLLPHSDPASPPSDSNGPTKTLPTKTQKQAVFDAVGWTAADPLFLPGARPPCAGRARGRGVVLLPRGGLRAPLRQRREAGGTCAEEASAGRGAGDLT